MTHPLPPITMLDVGPASWGPAYVLQQARKRRPLLFAPLAVALLVVGCSATPNIGTDVAVTGMPNAELALRDSMRVVDAEMGKLGVMAPAPVRRMAGPVVPGELQRVVTFAWTGGLDDGVRKLAASVGYAVAVALPPPGPTSLPPLEVVVSTGPVPVIEAFQALGEAAGTRALVRVDPSRRQVDVLYRA